MTDGTLQGDQDMSDEKRYPMVKKRKPEAAKASASRKPPRKPAPDCATDGAAAAVSESKDADPFKAMGGSESAKFNMVIFRETMGTVWTHGGEHDGLEQRMGAVLAAMAAFKAADEIEGMLAAQTVAMHFGAMECFRRAMIPEQGADMAAKLRKDGANLARGMTDMLAALDRKRGKGPQVVRVERVVVHEGGQAVVGNVTAGTAAANAAAQPAIAHEPPGPVLDMPAVTGERKARAASKGGRGEG